MYKDMSKIIVLSYFKRQLKPLVKKHRDLKDAVINTLHTFHPDHHDHLGDDVYKVRLSAKSLHRGKSNAFRLILLVVDVDDLLVPVTIYFKGDRETVSQKEMNDHLQHILFELDHHRGKIT